MSVLTKKKVNEQLQRVDDIYRGKVPDRYEGLKQSECTTDLEKIFWDVVTSTDFEYRTKRAQFDEVYRRAGIENHGHVEFEKRFSNGVIIRNLPADHKYELIGAGSFAEGDGWCCENCGQYIRHWCEVRDTQTGKTHLIGTECIKTIIKYDCTSEWQVQQIVSEAQKIRKLIREAKKRIDAGELTVEDKDEYRYYITNDNRTWAYIKLDRLEDFERKGVPLKKEDSPA